MATARGLLHVAAFLALALPAVLCQQAPGPSPAKALAPNVTAVLEKGGMYSTFMRLMKATQQDTQLNSQLNGSSSNGNGYTVFAPTDGAFGSLKAGTLNSLTQQQQVSLVQYHVVPQFYTQASFETTSNPVRTQASGSDGPYTFNITADNAGHANVTTGLVVAAVGMPLRAEQPLAVYSVDRVLLPNDLFGVKPPTPAPEAKKTPPASSKGHEGGSDAAQAPAGAADTPPSKGSGAAGGAAWSMAVAVLVAAANCLL